MFGIADKVLAYIGGGLALALAVALAWTTIHKNAELRGVRSNLATVTAERDRAQIDLGTSQANEATLRSGLAAANGSIERLRTEALQRDAAGTAARLEASTQSKSAASKAAALTAARPGADMAASTDALILESLQ